MRKTAKKLLALILTLAMLASTFAMAMTTVNAAEELVYSETFDNVTINADKTFQAAWIKGYYSSGAGLGNISIDSTTFAGEKVLKVDTDGTEGRYKLVPMLTKTTNYKFTVDVNFIDEVYLYVIPTADSGTTGIFQLLSGATRSYCDKDNVVGNTGTAAKTGKWYTVEFYKNGANLNLKLKERGASTYFYDQTRVCSHVAESATPWLELYKGVSAYFDNITFHDLTQNVLEDGENVLPNEWKSVYYDFEQGGPSNEHQGHWLSEGAGSSEYGFWVQPGSSAYKGLATTEGDNTNKYLKLQYEYTSFAQDTRFYLSPVLGNDVNTAVNGTTGLESNYYSFAFDLMLPALEEGVNGYYGLQIHAEWGKTGAGALWRIFNNAVASVDLEESDSQKIVGNNINVIPANDWVSVKFERNGTTITVTVADKENPSNILYRESRTFDYLTAASLPRLQFTGDLTKASQKNVTATAYIDNLRYENTTGKLDVVGVQSTAVANDKYSVRFIGTVNSTHAYDKLGFEVVASYTEGGVAKTKTFKLDTCQVYTSILASGAGNAPYVVSASQLGGEYLIALNITDIPSDLGEISFTVKAFGYYNNGIEVRSEVASFTATPNGTTVDLAKPAA